MGDEKLHDVEIMLTEVKASDKSSHKRIDGLEIETKDMKSDIQESVKSINELAYSVLEIANEMKAMRTDMNKEITAMRADMNKNDERLKSLEDKPAKRYDAIAEKIILVIVGSVVGYFLMKLGM